MSFLGPTGGIIALFTSRAEEYAAIARQASNSALGATASAAGRLNLAGAPNHRITMELTQNNKTIESIAFDVSLLAGDGFAQRISYGLSARQTIHHTPAGYYTDEFGLAPGEIDVDAEVVFTQTSGASQMGQFIKIFKDSKATSPLVSATVPMQVKWHDIYMGLSYIITLRELQMEQNTEMLNCARVRLLGNILGDYNSNVNAPKTQPTLTNQSSLAASLVGNLANPPETA